MNKYNIGFPKFRWEKGIPRILIKDSLATRTKWVVRAFAIFCVFISVISLPWYMALFFSFFCAVINLLVEKVIFYYFNEIEFASLAVPYDSSKWVMNGFTWHEPKLESQENDDFTIVFNDVEYAHEFFKLLSNWNQTTELKVSFVIDEDLYFVYLYPNHNSDVVNEKIKKLAEDNLPTKLLSEPFAEFEHLTICKSFPVGNFSLGGFVENHSEDSPFKLLAYYSDGSSKPKLISNIEPLIIKGYKARIPSELTMNEYEGAHWKLIIEPHRVAVGSQS